MNGKYQMESQGLMSIDNFFFIYLFIFSFS